MQDPFDFYKEVMDQIYDGKHTQGPQEPPNRHPLESAYDHTIRLCDNVRHNAAIINQNKTKGS